MKKKFKSQFHQHVKWWDYGFLLESMEMWFEKASYMHKHKGVLVRSEETSRKMKICQLLLKRIREDDIYLEPNRVFKGKNAVARGRLFGELELGLEPMSWSKDAKVRREQEIKFAFEYIAKHLDSFWD